VPDTAIAEALICSACGDPMLEPADLCGFCVEERAEADALELPDDDSEEIS
jgi:hypothetical protein